VIRGTSLNIAFKDNHLKLCCLWFDEVLVDTLIRHDEMCSKLIGGLVEYESNAGAIAKKLSDVIVPLARRADRSVIGDRFQESSRGYPRWGERNRNYTYPEPETTQEYAHNHLLGLIEQEHGVQHFKGWETEQAEGRARVAVDAVSLWERVNQSTSCMLQAGADEREAMIAMRTFRSGADTPVDPVRLLEVSIPSLTDVSWEKIVALNNSKDLDLLKTKMSEAAELAGSDFSRAQALLKRFEHDAIESILNFARPNVKKIAIESSIANIPMGLANPYSLYVAARDTASTTRRHAEVGWLYMLRDICHAGDRKDNSILSL